MIKLQLESLYENEERKIIMIRPHGVAYASQPLKP